MFLTVTPNACIERTSYLPGFQAGEVHRVPPEDLQVNVGGKGVNAARVATKFGIPVKALLWAGKNQAAWIGEQLHREAVPHELVETTADTRTCINILDGQGRKTEVVEAGNPLHVADGTRLLERYTELLPRTSVVALCGSYPPQLSSSNLLGGGANRPSPFDMHLTLLCRAARDAGVRLILDSKGVPFEMAVRHARPWCIKPNTDEAAQLLRREINSAEDELRALGDMLRLGAERVILSCGARGCYFATSAQTLFYHAPQVDEISSVGSGDSLVGAFAARLLMGDDELEALRWGVAAGAANAAQLQSGFCNLDDISPLLSQVAIDEIEV